MRTPRVPPPNANVDGFLPVVAAGAVDAWRFGGIARVERARATDEFKKESKIKSKQSTRRVSPARHSTLVRARRRELPSVARVARVVSRRGVDDDVFTPRAASCDVTLSTPRAIRRRVTRATPAHTRRARDDDAHNVRTRELSRAERVVARVDARHGA